MNVALEKENRKKEKEIIDVQEGGAGCSFSFGMTNDWSSSCIGVGCCAPVVEGFVDVCASVGACTPTIGILDSHASKV